MLFLAKCVQLRSSNRQEMAAQYNHKARLETKNVAWKDAHGIAYLLGLNMTKYP